MLTALTHESPDLVLLDARLRCLEPATFVRAWRAIARCERVPVVVRSALAEVPDPPRRLRGIVRSMPGVRETRFAPRAV